MHLSYWHLSFENVVDLFLRQDERRIAPTVRDSHNTLLFAATTETDGEQLARGIYRLRYYLAEGEALHQWMALLNRTSLLTDSPLTAVQREITFGWLLALNDQPELAARAYENAALLYKALAREPFGKVGHPSMQQAALDILIGMCFLRADQNPTPDDVDQAFYFWQRMWRQVAPDLEKRLLLALAALKFNTKMSESGYANADEAHHFFAGRGMNAEAGLAAFYMARYTAEREEIDPVHHAATGGTLRWLHRAVDHWHAIDLRIGERLLAPYIRHLDILPPPRKLSRRDRHLNPPAQALN